MVRYKLHYNVINTFGQPLHAEAPETPPVDNLCKSKSSSLASGAFHSAVPPLKCKRAKRAE